MQITKTTTKKYNVKFRLDAIVWTFREFAEARRKNNAREYSFANCFCCGHEFAGDEKLIFIEVDDDAGNNLGNRFACVKCLEKERSVKS